MRIVGSRLVEDDRVTRWGLASDGTPELTPNQVFEVAPLRAGWGNSESDQFESGAGPIFALQAAKRAVDSGANLVVIRCVDHLRSGYERSERDELMRIFEDLSIPRAYSALARQWCDDHDVSKHEFRDVARALEENYRKTAEARGLTIAPRGTHDAMVTDWFRRIDCANPNIDFECELWCASESFASELDQTGATVSSIETIRAPDGPENTASIASYTHLTNVVSAACDAADTTIEHVWNGAALELYTCFPIVPLAFLFATGLADDIDAALRLIESREVTLSGGMTLGRAPWNGPALRGLALAAQKVETDGCPALVHGNGGLGGKQAITVLT